MEYITDANYAHAKKVCKILNEKKRISWFVC